MLSMSLTSLLFGAYFFHPRIKAKVSREIQLTVSRLREMGAFSSKSTIFQILMQSNNQVEQP